MISVSQIVHSTYSTSHSVEIWTWLLPLWYRKRQAELFLQRSGLDYTIVRPGGLRNDSGVVCSNFTPGWVAGSRNSSLYCRIHLVSVLCVKEMRVVCHRSINLSKVTHNVGGTRDCQKRQKNSKRIYCAEMCLVVNCMDCKMNLLGQ